MNVAVRATVVVAGMLMMLGGLSAIVLLPNDAPGGLWLIVMGAFFVVVPLLERQRYRSEAAEKAHQSPGPGGGEARDGAIEPRFRPTAEVFVDPTTGHRMRVLVDPKTGERRYVAEG
jgi:hypothetical protein